MTLILSNYLKIDVEEGLYMLPVWLHIDIVSPKTCIPWLSTSSVVMYMLYIISHYINSTISWETNHCKTTLSRAPHYISTFSLSERYSVIFHYRVKRSTLSRKMTSKLLYRNKQDKKTLRVFVVRVVMNSSHHST